MLLVVVYTTFWFAWGEQVHGEAQMLPVEQKKSGKADFDFHND